MIELEEEMTGIERTGGRGSGLQNCCERSRGQRSEVAQTWVMPDSPLLRIWRGGLVCLRSHMYLAALTLILTFLIFLLLECTVESTRPSRSRSLKLRPILAHLLVLTVGPIYNPRPLLNFWGQTLASWPTQTPDLPFTPQSPLIARTLSWASSPGLARTGPLHSLPQ